MCAALALHKLEQTDAATSTTNKNGGYGKKQLFQLSFHKVRRNRTNIMAIHNFVSNSTNNNSNSYNQGGTSYGNSHDYSLGNSDGFDRGNKDGGRGAFRRTNSSNSFTNTGGGGGGGRGFGGGGGLWGDMFFARQGGEPAAPQHSRGGGGRFRGACWDMLRFYVEELSFVACFFWLSYISWVVYSLSTHTACTAELQQLFTCQSVLYNPK